LNPTAPATPPARGENARTPGPNEEVAHGARFLWERFWKKFGKKTGKKFQEIFGMVEMYR
jgi:hypothetical protein